AHLQNDELVELLEHGEWTTVGPGETVIRQGEIGDSFYAIGSGQVEVRKDGRTVDVMGAGRFFGELALLHDVPRTATVLTRTPTRMFRLDRTGFERLVAGAFKAGNVRSNAALASSEAASIH